MKTTRKFISLRTLIPDFTFPTDIMQEIGEGGQIRIKQNLHPYLVSKQVPYNEGRRSQNSLSITHMRGGRQFYAAFHLTVLLRFFAVNAIICDP